MFKCKKDFKSKNEKKKFKTDTKLFKNKSNYKINKRRTSKMKWHIKKKKNRTHNIKEFDELSDTQHNGRNAKGQGKLAKWMESLNYVL